jgi:hypothetical protein
LILLIQLATLAEEDLAPRYYDAGTKARKRKLISTKDLEKRKKAATTPEAEDEILGENIPTKRYDIIHLVTFILGDSTPNLPHLFSEPGPLCPSCAPT